jgi:hypothetical protein
MAAICSCNFPTGDSGQGWLKRRSMCALTCAQPHNKAPVGLLGQIPCGVRQCERAAPEPDGDSRPELKSGGVFGHQRQREKRMALGFAAPQAGCAQLFGAAGQIWDFFQGGGRYGDVKFHDNLLNILVEYLSG